jgi:hypothetical protein
MVAAEKDVRFDRPRILLGVVLFLGGALAVFLGRYTHTRVTGLFPAFLDGRYPWLSVCFGATFVMHLITLDERSRRYLLYAAVPAEAPTLLEGVIGGTPIYPFGLGLALVAVAYRAVLLFSSRGEARSVQGRALFDSLIPPFFGLISPVFLACTGTFLPRVLDLRMQQVGGLLGPLPPIWIGQLFDTLTPLKVLCTIVYGTLPVGIAVVHAVRFKRDPSETPRLLLAFVLIALFGYPLYFLLPMVGPREAWAALNAHAEFPPRAIPVFESTSLIVGRLPPRNCMPSLHTAWSLSLLLSCRGLSRRMLSFGVGWFVCTELATLGLGEHWLIDLVVALPFTFAVYSLTTTVQSSLDWVRRGVLVAITAGWFFALTGDLDALVADTASVVVAMIGTVGAALFIGLPMGRTDRGRVAGFGTAPEQMTGTHDLDGWHAQEALTKERAQLRQTPLE